MKEVKANVKLPEGTCCAYDCKACEWFDTGEKDSSGKIWCTRNHAYSKQN